jgi:hypothetical protein
MKHAAPPKANKVLNGGTPPLILIFAFLSHFTKGKPRSDMRFNVNNNGEPLTFTLMLFL